MPELAPLLPRAVHGGPSAHAFSGLDFSVNANPYGPNPALLRAIQSADYAHYPDPAYQAVRETLGAWHGVSSAEVALSVGASDLLHRLVRAFVPAGAGILSIHAPFGELARAAQLQRAKLEVRPSAPPRLTKGVRLVYVGHPHNPTGHLHSAAELLALAQSCAEVGALLIVDEAYAPFVMGAPALNHPAAVRLLSPGKAHGLVGARPAYALASPQVVARLDNLAPAWHLPASTASVLAALPQAQDFLGTLVQVQQDAQALAAALSRFGAVQHHSTPFMLLEVGDAARLSGALFKRGYRVRDCASYGLARCIRLSTRRPQDNGSLLRALGELKDA